MNPIKSTKSLNHRAVQVLPRASATRKAGLYWGEIEISPGITAERVLMTPEMASAFLDTQTDHQRTLKLPHLGAVRRDIEAGRWKFNGEPILFNVNRELINGQHRCEACVASGIPIDVIIIRGIPVESYDSIDNTAKRTGADAVRHVAGNATATASALGILHRYDQGMSLKSTFVSSPTMISEMMGMHPGIIRSVNEARKCRPIIPSLSAAAFCHYVLSRIDSDEADKFFDSLATGENLAKGNPILTLRNKFIEDKNDKKRVEHWQMIHYVFRVWNAIRINKPLCVIRAIRDDAELPTPI